MTSLASLLLYVLAYLAKNPKYFIGLIWSSIGFVLGGAVLFSYWGYNWILHSHLHTMDHHEDHGDEKDNQLLEKDDNKTLTHEHYHFHKRVDYNPHD